MAESSFTSIDTRDGVVVARITREKVTEYEAPIILKELSEAAAGGRYRIAVDFTEVRFLTSAGLGALVSLHRTCKNESGRLAVFGLAREVVDLLKLTHLDKIIVAAKDRAAAVKAVA